MPDLPEVGLKAVIENADGFVRDSQRVKDAFAQIADAEARLAKTSPQALQAFNQFSTGIVENMNDVEAYADELADLADHFDSVGTAGQGMIEKLAQLTALQSLQTVARSAEQAGDAMLDFSKDTVMTAARIEELSLVLGNLAEQNDVSAAAMQEQVEAIRAQGVQADVAYSLVTQFVQANLDLSKASQLARVAQDAAVISMEDSSQALAGILQGVITLQPEMLRYRGLIVDLEGEYRKWAETSGKSYAELTGNEKQMIALNAAIEAGGKITGTYESAMESASKQLRSFPRYIADLKAEMGESLLPVFSDAIFATKDLLKAIGDLPDPMKAGASASIALAGGMLKIGGSAVGVATQVGQLALAVKTLGLEAKVASLGFLGPAGLVVGLAAVAGVGIYSAVKAHEEAVRQEAAAVAGAADSYREYLQELRAANNETPPLTEELWELSQAADAVAQGFDAISLLEAREEIDKFMKEQQALLDTFEGLNAGVEGPLENAFGAMVLGMTDAQLAVAATRGELVQMFREMGYGVEQALALADALREAALAEQELRAHAENEAEFEHRRWQELGNQMQQARQVQDAYYDDQKRRADEYAASLEKRAEGEKGYVQISKEAYGQAIELGGDAAAAVLQVGDAYYRAVPAIVAFRNAQEQTAAAVDAFAERAASQIVAAEEEANGRILQADETLKQQQADLWTDYQGRVNDVQEDIAQVGVDLAKDIVKAEQAAAREREQIHLDMASSIEQAERDLAQSIIDLQTDTARQLAELEQELARELEQLAQDTRQAREDAERAYRDDVQDAQLDLVRDMENIERDHESKMLDLAISYWEDVVDLARSYGEKLSDINEEYARQRQDIEEKYSTEPPEPDFDERREAIMERIRKLEELSRQGTGVWYKGEIDLLKQQLEELKEEELAALEERKAAELAELEAWLAAEQEKIDEAFAIAAAKEQIAYEERKAERVIQYEQQLEDLRIALEREQEEIALDAERKREDLLRRNEERRQAINADAEQRYQDLLAQHERERAEIERRTAEALAQVDDRLAEEKEKLAQAAAERTQQLADQLAEERQNHDDRLAELVRANEDRKAEIDAALQTEVETIQQKALEGTTAYISEIKGIGPDAQAELQRMAGENLGPALDEWIRVITERAAAAHKAWMDNFVTPVEQSIEPGSPSKWMLGLVRSMADAVDVGRPAVDAALRGIAADVENFQAQIAAPFQGIPGKAMGGWTDLLPELGNVGGVPETPTVPAPTLPVLPTPPAPTVVTPRPEYNLNYTGQEQSKSSIKTLFTLMEMASGGE